MKDFVNSLQYIIPAGMGRRITWADQVGGYLDVYSSEFSRGAGYVGLTEKQIRIYKAIR